MFLRLSSRVCFRDKVASFQASFVRRHPKGQPDRTDGRGRTSEPLVTGLLLGLLCSSSSSFVRPAGREMRVHLHISCLFFHTDALRCIATRLLLFFSFSPHMMRIVFCALLPSSKKGETFSHYTYEALWVGASYKCFWCLPKGWGYGWWWLEKTFGLFGGKRWLDGAWRNEDVTHSAHGAEMLSWAHSLSRYSLIETISLGRPFLAFFSFSDPPAAYLTKMNTVGINSQSGLIMHTSTW